MAALAFAGSLTLVAAAIPRDAWADQTGDAKTGAEESRPRPPYAFSMRVFAGLGPTGGTVNGFASTGGLAGEGWFSEHLGVGAFYRGTAVSTLFYGGTGNDNGLGLALLARTAGRGSYGLLSAGVGYEWGAGSKSDSCGGSDDNGCAPTPFAGALVDITAAWLFPIDAVEIGPSLSVDVFTGWGTRAYILGLDVGFVQ